jgi:hypothetical protein
MTGGAERKDLDERKPGATLGTELEAGGRAVLQFCILYHLNKITSAQKSQLLHL